MHLIDTFRDPDLARRLIAEIHNLAHRPLAFMEFCGGHTHAIMQHGIRQLMPENVRLLSGPGCPVCVTSQRDIDYAIALSQLPDVVIATFGDMVRVPGTSFTLQEAAAAGSHVRILYSPLDAVRYAQEHPEKQVIFLGVGFETTAPGVAASILQARALALSNYTIFSMHKYTPPGMHAILNAGEVRLHGIIGPGHVSAIIGLDGWQFLPEQYAMPVVVAGFEPVDILLALRNLVELAISGQARALNAYNRSVVPQGNPAALKIMNQVFETTDADWRGFGFIPQSGMGIRPEFQEYDAAVRFALPDVPSREPPGCRCGDVLRGVIEPPACPLYGKACTPQRPKGPCMVSDEGACSAYYLYQTPVE
jgi:hydrogenase expression/formation protein HypD